MKTIFLVIGSIISNRILAGLLHNTAEPMARNMIRKTTKLVARTVIACLVGALVFSAGIIVSFIELGNQLAETGVVYFSPSIWFGLGMVLVGAIFIYLAAFSNLLSPWRKQEKRDEEREDLGENTFSHMAESLIAAVQDRSDAHKERARRRYRERPRPADTSRAPSEHAQTDFRDYNEPLH